MDKKAIKKKWKRDQARQKELAFAWKNDFPYTVKEGDQEYFKEGSRVLELPLLNFGRVSIELFDNPYGDWPEEVFKLSSTRFKTWIDMWELGEQVCITYDYFDNPSRKLVRIPFAAKKRKEFLC